MGGRRDKKKRKGKKRKNEKAGSRSDPDFTVLLPLCSFVYTNRILSTAELHSDARDTFSARFAAAAPQTQKGTPAMALLTQLKVILLISAFSLGTIV